MYILHPVAQDGRQEVVLRSAPLHRVCVFAQREQIGILRITHLHSFADASDRHDVLGAGLHGLARRVGVRVGCAVVLRRVRNVGGAFDEGAVGVDRRVSCRK